MNLTSLLIFANYINIKWRVRNSRNLNQYDYTHSLIYSRKDETKETIIDPAPARRGGSDAVECTDGCHRR